MVWKQNSPFRSLWKMEETLQSFFHKSSFARRTLDQYVRTGSRIYDFRTGERVLNDEAFIEACLSKISLEGKGSLSLREKFRLWRLSRQRKHRHPNR